MKKDEVRVRFAPSPTGFLHIGGARTALFNYLYAKRHNGVFVLRVEDTDQARSTQEAAEAILDGLSWLGLSWDEGPFFQSERYDLYKEYIDQLVKEEKAYRCYCSPETLEQMREELKAQKKKPMYDGRCFSRRHEKNDQPFVIRFRVPQGQTTVHDLVKGDVTVDHKEIEDLVIARSDGTPTYNFVVVVDDAVMKITHVIRGDDHLNNTPKQILMYQALGFDVPQFAHLPLILGQDKTRLSKRHGATSVQMYRDMGYFPHAILNFLVRLGWSHKDQEIFSMAEMIEKFDFDAVGKSPGVFNPEKLLWINQHYMKHNSLEELVSGIEQYIEIPASRKNAPEMKKVIDALRDRAKTLDELAKLSSFYIQDEVVISKEDQLKFLTSDTKEPMQTFLQKIQSLNDWQHDALEKIFQETLTDHQLKFKSLGQPLRIILTASQFSPGIYDILEILGKDRSISRIQKALQTLY
ncbi:MAG: glutamate--tRNA ligase [Bdellovibrionales bacterium]|nr:glutamate--tRNA ligase [Bdellovibrionales bacterium]